LRIHKVLHTVKKSLFKLTVPILALPRAAKRCAALSGSALWAVGVSIAIALPVFMVSGLYRAIFRYSGWQQEAQADRLGLSRCG
jgi:hypothetical protein